MSKWSPLLLSVLRLVTGLLFVEHGTQKAVFRRTAGASP